MKLEWNDPEAIAGYPGSSGSYEVMSRGGEAAGDMDGTEPEPEAEVEASVPGPEMEADWSSWMPEAGAVGGEAPSPWSLPDARFLAGYSVKSVMEPAEFLLCLDCLFLLLGLLGSSLC